MLRSIPPGGSAELSSPSPQWIKLGATVPFGLASIDARKYSKKFFFCFLHAISLNCRVLVVDDRREIRFLSKHLLTQAGAMVDECADGQLAVEHVMACLGTSNCPDLILLDMQMPNLDGYEAARTLRKLGYTGPIIALTADAMQGDMNECLEAGCDGYLSKPIDKAAMLQKIGGLFSGDHNKY